MARRDALTLEIQERVCEAIRLGVPYKHAARAAGIAESTFYKWLREGQAAKQGKRKAFALAIEKARSECVVNLVAQLHLHLPRNWQAIMTLLERRYPEDFARTVRHELSGDVGIASADVRQARGELRQIVGGKAVGAIAGGNGHGRVLPIGGNGAGGESKKA